MLEDPMIATHLDPLEQYLDSQITKLKEKTPYSVHGCGTPGVIRSQSVPTPGIVIDAQGAKWHFSGNPQKQYKFFKKTSEDIVVSAFELLQNEGKHLSPAQARKTPRYSWTKNETCFQPGGRAHALY
ncbi:hypothetical protein TNCV_1820101 [Trichonephila clavipes]|nr:hypothetical protein TNCV_1820101 [Trichonephila clavipes]